MPFLAWIRKWERYSFPSMAGQTSCCCLVTSVMSDSVRPHRRQPRRLPRPWDSPGRNTGVGCHFLLQCMKVKSESEVAQLCPPLSYPMDCSPPGSSIHGIFQARVLEWGAVAFSRTNKLEDHNLSFGDFLVKLMRHYRIFFLCSPKKKKKNQPSQDFRGSPVVKESALQRRELEFDPCLENKDPTCHSATVCAPPHCNYWTNEPHLESLCTAMADPSRGSKDPACHN